MSYYLGKILPIAFDKAVTRTTRSPNANAMTQDANQVAICSFGLKEQKERYDETDHQ